MDIHHAHLQLQRSMVRKMRIIIRNIRVKNMAYCCTEHCGRNKIGCRCQKSMHGRMEQEGVPQRPVARCCSAPGPSARRWRRPTLMTRPPPVKEGSDRYARLQQRRKKRRDFVAASLCGEASAMCYRVGLWAVKEKRKIRGLNACMH